MVLQRRGGQNEAEALTRQTEMLAQHAGALGERASASTLQLQRQIEERTSELEQASLANQSLQHAVDAGIEARERLLEEVRARDDREKELSRNVKRLRQQLAQTKRQLEREQRRGLGSRGGGEGLLDERGGRGDGVDGRGDGDEQRGSYAHMHGRDRRNRRHQQLPHHTAALRSTRKALASANKRVASLERTVGVLQRKWKKAEEDAAHAEDRAMKEARRALRKMVAQHHRALRYHENRNGGSDGAHHDGDSRHSHGRRQDVGYDGHEISARRPHDDESSLVYATQALAPADGGGWGGGGGGGGGGEGGDHGCVCGGWRVDVCVCLSGRLS
mgnify:CR=1 FL=1